MNDFYGKKFPKIEKKNFDDFIFQKFLEFFSNFSK